MGVRSLPPTPQTKNPRYRPAHFGSISRAYDSSEDVAHFENRSHRF